jgi:hypothetical protein
MSETESVIGPKRAHARVVTAFVRLVRIPQDPKNSSEHPAEGDRRSYFRLVPYHTVANPCTVTNVTTSVTTLLLAESGLINVGRLIGANRFLNRPLAANSGWMRALRCAFQEGMCIQ